MNRVSTEDVLNKAYRLAYFLHQDKGIALRIVVAATLKLHVAMAVQSKRLSYIPVGRFSPGESRRTDGIRNKALFSNLHLLQRLVYGESEPYERQKEHAATDRSQGVRADDDPVSEEDLLVYFIKHLVRITTKRNAFYVTLGVSRLLHSYSTLETMEIYNAVIGEPERVKDDYYYRSRKGVLMHEMYQRFGELIRASRQRRGEERFETQQGTSELRSLVRECLRLFTPWDTQCHVPRDFDPLKSVIASLTSRSSADENKIEVNRIHAILHPDCYQRLIAAFGYGSPEERMELPRFYSERSDDQSPPRQRSAPSELSAEELAEVNHMLDEQAGRRRRSSPTAVIRVMVDGVERGRLNPVEQSSVSFSVAEDAEIIEVKTTDQQGELLLATHLLTSFGREPTSVSIRLESGQDLSLSISRQIEENDGGDFLVKFDYRETSLVRAARLWWQRLGVRRGAERGLWEGATASMALRLIVVASVVAICLVSYFAYVKLSSPQTTEPTQVTNVQPPTPTFSNPPATETPPPVNGRSNGPDQATAKATRQPKTESIAARNRPSQSTSVPAPAQEEEIDSGATRSGNAVANVKLSEVKKIYIEVRGDAALRSKLAEHLGSSGVVAVAANPDDADAALKIVVSQTNEASARLVNARGTILWQKTGQDKTASEIVKDLISGIRQARKRD